MCDELGVLGLAKSGQGDLRQDKDTIYGRAGLGGEGERRCPEYQFEAECGVGINYFTVNPSIHPSMSGFICLPKYAGTHSILPVHSSFSFSFNQLYLHPSFSSLSSFFTPLAPFLARTSPYRGLRERGELHRPHKE